MKYLLVIVACCVLSLASCKNDRDGKNAIDRHNEKVAEEAVRAIKTPIEEAKNAVDQENIHNKQMEDQLKSE